METSKVETSKAKKLPGNPTGKNKNGTGRQSLKEKKERIARNSESFPVWYAYLATGDKVRIKLQKRFELFKASEKEEFSHIIFPRYSHQKKEAYNPYEREFVGTIMAIFPDRIIVLYTRHYPFNESFTFSSPGAVIYTDASYAQRIKENDESPKGGKVSQISGLPLGQRWEIVFNSVTGLIRNRKKALQKQMEELSLPL